MYHISQTWNHDVELITPRKPTRSDSCDSRDRRPTICVCPTPEQCLVALGSWQDYGKLRLYKTNSKETPVPADWVFDFEVTAEHRLYRKAKFEFVGETTVSKLISLGIPDLSLVSNNDATILKNARKILARFKHLEETPWK